MACAGIWELFEYGVVYFLGFDLQNQVDTLVVDTMEDMLVALLGGISCFGIMVYQKKNNYLL